VVIGWYHIIRIFLIFDDFYNYHFEPRQNMSNFLFVFGFQFSHEQFLVCFWISIFSMPKRIGQALGKESHTFGTKFWALNP
jgi:hypothetical protein